jgi:RecA-family ATPase
MPAHPYATLPAGELERTTAPLAWIVDGLFLEAGAGILGGAPKSGKSFLALDLCVAIASATSCAGHFHVLAPGPVVLLCAEDPPAVVSSRLTALARARGRALKDLPIEVIVETAVRLPDGLARLEATLSSFRPRLLLLDPLIRLHRADENSASEMSVILDGLRGLARTSKTAILLVHL